jgi:hypothetical protein
VLTDEQAHAFFDGIAEMLPIASVRDAVIYLLPGVFGTVCAAVLAVRRRSLGWSYATLCAVALLLMAVLHRRFATYSACAGAALVPVACTLISRHYDRRAPALAAAARIVLLLGLILGPPLAQRMTASAAVRAGTAAGGTCDLQAAVPMLAPFAGQVVLADVNDTPELLYRTGVLTVGSLYHRNPEAFLRLRAAWRSSPDGPIPPAVEATRASLVLFCRYAKRSFMVSGLPHETLWDRLARGEPPGWLERTGEGEASGYTVYRVVR